MLLVHLKHRSMDVATFKFVKALADSQSIDASNAVSAGRQKTSIYPRLRNRTSFTLGYCSRIDVVHRRMISVFWWAVQERELGEKLCLSEEFASLFQQQQYFGGLAVNIIRHVREFTIWSPITMATLLLSHF